MPAAGFLFLSILYFYRHIFLGMTSFADDLSYFHFFEKSLYAREIRSGIVPLWNPHIFGGTPHLANVNNACFYPFNLFFLLGPFHAVLTLYLALHLCIAGLSVYLWGRKLGFSRFASFLSGLLYMFSGVFATENIHLGYFAALAWTPAVFYAMEIWLEERAIRPAIAVGLLLSLILMSGAPQFLLITGYCLVFYTIFRLMEPGQGVRGRMDGLAVLIVGAGLGLMAAAVQLLPAMEFIKDGGRPYATDYQFAVSFSSYWKQLLSRPFAPVGHGWTGAAALFFAAWALLFMRSRAVATLFLLALATALLSLGDDGFLFKVAHRFLPGFQLFRAPYRFALYAVLFIVLMSGAGIDSVIRSSVSRWRRFGLSFIALFLGWGIWSCFHAEGSIERLWKSTAWLLLIYGLVRLFLKAQIREALFKAGLCLFLLLEVTQELTTLGGVHPLTKPSFYRFLQEQPIFDELKKQEETHRIYLSNDDGIACLEYPLKDGRYFPFSPNLGELYGFENVSGYEQMMLRRYIRFIQETPPYWSMALFNVRYLLTRGDLSGLPGLKLVLAVPAGRLYRMEWTIPRYFMAASARFTDRPENFFESVRDPAFNPYTQLILEGDPPAVTGQPPLRSYEINVLKRTSRDQLLEVKLDGHGYLVCSEPYEKGWKAFIDDQPASLWPAFHLLRAVYLPPGKHLVRFYYDPPSFNLGLGISLISFAVILAISLLSRRRQRSAA